MQTDFLPDHPRRVLVIQLGDIGDVVLATPTFRAIGETFPAARVSVLVRKGCGPLLAAEPYISEVLESARTRGKLAEIGGDNLALIRRLRAARYDLVIDLRTGDRGAILAFLTGAPARVARESPGDSFWRRFAFTRLIPDPPYAPLPVNPGADQSLRMVRALGIQTRDSVPRLRVPDGALERVRALLRAEGVAPGGQFATMNPFSRWKYKEWPHERWPAVIDRLAARHDLRSLIVGAREDAAAADAIVRGCRGDALNVAGKTTLGELAALLSMSSLHVGVDSAAPHIAAAVGTPTVTIFGPTNWKGWVVEDATHRVVAPDLDCAPCGAKGCDGAGTSRCLDDLRTETVIARVEEVAGAAAPRA